MSDDAGDDDRWVELWACDHAGYGRRWEELGMSPGRKAMLQALVATAGIVGVVAACMRYGG